MAEDSVLLECDGVTVCFPMSRKYRVPSKCQEIHTSDTLSHPRNKLSAINIFYVLLKDRDKRWTYVVSNVVRRQII